jgi:hypothetical protein
MSLLEHRSIHQNLKLALFHKEKAQIEKIT